MHAKTKSNHVSKNTVQTILQRCLRQNVNSYLKAKCKEVHILNLNKAQLQQSSQDFVKPNVLHVQVFKLAVVQVPN